LLPVAKTAMSALAFQSTGIVSRSVASMAKTATPSKSMLMDWEGLPTIQTDRLSLRWISAKDVEDFYAIYSDPKVMRYWSTPPLPDRNAASNLVSEIHEGFKRRELLKWASRGSQTIS
jgi:RimJ/RimL family protein N-acetyltransferase